MADEARVQVSLQIVKGSFRYQSQPVSWTADVSVGFGPVPGALNIPYGGLNIDFAELDQPGLVRITNLDPTNYVTWGVWDGSRFYPMGELLPGDPPAFFRFSRSLNVEFTGTGTLDSGDRNYLRIEPHLAACRVLVEAFET